VATLFAYPVEWYARAAEDDDSEAVGYLDACYENGEGVVVDYAKVFEWYARGSVAGNITFTCSLDIFCGCGRGAVWDEVKAVQLYKRGAEAGDAAPAQRLCVCFEGGTSELLSPRLDTLVR
jgi:uncharacterized protein